jgi:hypothetical protein
MWSPTKKNIYLNVANIIFFFFLQKCGIAKCLGSRTIFLVNYYFRKLRFAIEKINGNKDMSLIKTEVVGTKTTRTLLLFY